MVSPSGDAQSVQTRSYWQAPKEAAGSSGLVSAGGSFRHGLLGVSRRTQTVAFSDDARRDAAAPNLSLNAKQATDRQLFWILEHGVKNSGMPL
jgi:hypothetical protein